MKTFDFSTDSGLCDGPSQGGSCFRPPALVGGGAIAKPGTLEHAFETVKFGDVGNPNAFLSAVFAGHPDLPGLAKGTNEFVWTGFVFDDKTKANKPGKFFIVSPYPIANKAPAGDYGKGLGRGNVATQCVLCVEVDEEDDGSTVPLAEQCRRLDALVALGLPKPNAVCLSGGKSVHAFWAVSGLTTGIRERLQTRLLALTGADPSVGDPGRKMRLGGFKDDKRTQTILALDSTPTTPEAMEAGLLAGCVAWDMAEEPEAVLAARFAARSARHGAKGQGGSKVGKNGNKVAVWDPATVQLTLAGGRVAYAAALGEGKHACRCPYHTDSTPSAVCFVDSRRVSLFCSTCGTTWQQDAPRVHTDTTKPPVAGEVRFNLPYFPPIRSFTNEVALIRSARGTGKTTAVIRGMHNELAGHPNRRAIVIVHRRALVAKYLNDLNGLGFVGMPEAGPIVGDRVVVCLDSLPRVPLFASTDVAVPMEDMPVLPWHVAYIDEIEQVIGHLDADSLKRNTTPERVVWALQMILGASANVILADADLGGLTNEFVGLLGLPTPHAYANEFQPDRAARMYTHQTGVEAKLWADWGASKRAAVACTTKADATRIAQRLAETRPTANVVCVTSDTSGQYADLIANPDAWTRANRPDALVYSPSLGTGVDVSLRDYWDCVFVVADTGNWTDVFAIMQAAERVRNPKERERHIWIRDGHLFGVTDLATLRRAYDSKPRREIVTAREWGQLPIGGTWRTTICDTTREILIRARANRARAQGRIRADVVHAMVAAGWALTWEADDADDAARKQIRAERKAIKDAWIDAVAQAAPMPLDDAKAVLRSSAPMAERARALKSVLTDKLGVTPDADLTRDWLYGDLAGKIRIFGLWALKAQHGDRLADAIQWNLDRVRESSSVPDTLATVDQFAKVMATLAVSHEMSMVNILTTSNSCDTPTDPKKIGETLGRGGVKRVRNRSRINGVVTSTYTIDPASVERMERMTARWMERRGVTKGDGLDDVVKALLDGDD